MDQQKGQMHFSSPAHACHFFPPSVQFPQICKNTHQTVLKYDSLCWCGNTILSLKLSSFFFFALLSLIYKHYTGSSLELGVFCVLEWFIWMLRGLRNKPSFENGHGQGEKSQIGANVERKIKVWRTIAQGHFNKLYQGLAPWRKNNKEMKSDSRLLHNTVWWETTKWHRGKDLALNIPGLVCQQLVFVVPLQRGRRLCSELAVEHSLPVPHYHLVLRSDHRPREALIC